MTLSGVTKWWWMSPYCSPNHWANWPLIYDPAWLAEQGVGLLLVPAVTDWLQSGTLEDDLPPDDPMVNFDHYYGPAVESCAEYGIPVMLGISGISYAYEFSNYDPNLAGAPHLNPYTPDDPTPYTVFTMPGSYWESRYAALFTAIEAKWGPNGSDGSVLVGYWSEDFTDNMLDWFRGFTNLELRQGIYHNMWHVAGSADNYIGNGTNESMESAMTRRMSMVDGVDIEVWTYTDILPIYDLQGCAKYIRDNFPDISLGLNAAAGWGPIYDYTIPWPDHDPPYMVMAHAQWSVMMGFDVLGNDLPEPFAVQTARFEKAANTIKDGIGKFDVISIQTSNGNEDITLFDIDIPSWYPRVKTDPTWWEYQQSAIVYWDSLNLLDLGTKCVATTNAGGLIPSYRITPCSVAPEDTFVNTGNEIILLKDGGAASTHDITVTSSLDPLINTPYTLPLSPDRGTIIGPYPLDNYGALPTITYDNTNLYVSIIKVEPTA